MTALALPDLPAGSHTPPARRPLLAQCLVLAGLLHLLLVLVFGNTPGGSARPGEGLWGAFQVRLVGTGPAGRPDAAAVETPHTGPPGQADRQRFGGAVRPAAEPRAADGPGAARAGRWLLQAAEGDAQATPQATSSNPAAAVPPNTVAELPARQSVDAGRPLPAADAPSPGVTAPSLPPTPAADAPLPARQLLRPAGPPAPVQADPAPTVALQAPPLPNFAAQPAAPPPAAVARIAPSAVTAPAPGHLALQSADRPALPQFAVAAPEAAVASAGVDNPVLAPSPAQTAAVVASPVPASPVGVGPVAGAPDAGARLGHDIATVPSQPAPAARLNLDLVRPRGGPITAQGSRGLWSVLPHPPELKTALEKEIELSGLADCRKAYSAMGLAAVVPLAADALRQKGCRW